MSHNDIWLAVDKLAASKGLSPSALAKKAGLDATTFNKSKRILNDGRLRWPSTESIMQILAATQTSWDEFIGFMGEETTEKNTQISLPFMAMSAAHFADSPLHSEDLSLSLDKITLPTFERGVYFVVEVNGSAYTPLYRDGDRLLISKETVLRRGDRVFLLPNKGSAALAEFVRQTDSHVDLKPLTSQKDSFSLNLDEIKLIARIVGVSQ